MIGKVHKGNSFRATVNYVLQREKAQILDSTMLSTDTENIINEFRLSRNLNPDLKNPVYHLILCFSDIDIESQTLTNAKLVELSMKHFAGIVESAFDHQLLEERNLFRYQQAVTAFLKSKIFEYQLLTVRHDDTDHLHTHLVASRINVLDGLAVTTYLDRTRSQKICRILENEYGLEQLNSSWEINIRSASQRQITNSTITGILTVQERLQKKINRIAIAEKYQRFNEFVIALQKEGVDVKIYPRGEAIGLSFAMDGVAIRASKLGQKYTYKGLLRELGIGDSHP